MNTKPCTELRPDDNHFTFSKHGRNQPHGGYPMNNDIRTTRNSNGTYTLEPLTFRAKFAMAKSFNAGDEARAVVLNRQSAAKFLADHAFTANHSFN